MKTQKYPKRHAGLDPAAGSLEITGFPLARECRQREDSIFSETPLCCSKRAVAFEHVLSFCGEAAFAKSPRDFVQKKTVISLGADNGFFAGCMLTSGHYQPLVPVAAEKDDYEDKNDDNKVDNGDVPLHGRFRIPFSSPISAKKLGVKVKSGFAAFYRLVAGRLWLVVKGKATEPQRREEREVFFLNRVAG